MAYASSLGLHLLLVSLSANQQIGGRGYCLGIGEPLPPVGRGRQPYQVTTFSPKTVRGKKHFAQWTNIRSEIHF